LYANWFSQGRFPSSCVIPTGLGKTSVIAIWLLSLAHGAKVPRRLVYVVNRRTVVDQTTDEVEKYRKCLNENPDLAELKPKIGSLALSTLRGQFADNREWSADPSRPAVICGTVDMIGSRLLFSGYGIGFKQKPLHAGFLGQDALLVHDEAHLEPAFQELVVAIEKEQIRCDDFRPLRVMELTATSRNSSETFQLGPNDYENPEIVRRINAAKKLSLIPNKDKGKLADEIVGLLAKHAKSEDAILVFVRKVDDVSKIVKKLPKDSTEQLTGTLRGLERDSLVKRPIFQRFLPEPSRDSRVKPAEGTVYLVCTSAGEVGVNISADHLICDLSTFDSMAQRFGRVNRFGQRDNTRIDVIYPTEFDQDDSVESRQSNTLALLHKLNGDASPDALGKLPLDDRRGAFAPPPTILPTSDILFDSWALTTIRGKLPGRPPVEPYLHGISEWQPPETHVAWRQEVELLQPIYENEFDQQANQAADRKRLAGFIPELLDDYPLKPHELLRANSSRVFKILETLRAAKSTPIWIIAENDIARVTTLGELAEEGKEAIEDRTVIIPPRAGGLTNGVLSTDDYDPDRVDYDVADEWRNNKSERLRMRVDDREEVAVKDMRLIRAVPLPRIRDDDADEENAWFLFEVPSEGGSTNKKPVLWQVHVEDVKREAKAILDKLPLEPSLRKVIEIAAAYHDHGKKRKKFQLVLGNLDPNVWWAKSGKKGGAIPESYRHEFGSLLDIQEFRNDVDLDEDQWELVLHLIATHHGRGRPHFPEEEAFDPEWSLKIAAEIACEVPRRYARLQRKYGRWGLAYLESLLRAADWAASAKPSAFLEERS